VRSVSRREWLTGCLALTSGAVAAGAATASQATVSSRKVHTVSGPIDAAQLGLTLMHEHVVVDFIGASQISASRYDADAVFSRALPHLQRVKALGGATLVECTPATSVGIRACSSASPRRPASTSCRTPGTTARTTASTCRHTCSRRARSSLQCAGFASGNAG
jgi:hypothetical protein